MLVREKKFRREASEKCLLRNLVLIFEVEGAVTLSQQMKAFREIFTRLSDTANFNLASLNSFNIKFCFSPQAYFNCCTLCSSSVI